MITCIACGARVKKPQALLCGKCSSPYGCYGPKIIADHETLFAVKTKLDLGGIHRRPWGVYSSYTDAAAAAHRIKGDP
jgi:hypothetical protein